LLLLLLDGLGAEFHLFGLAQNVDRRFLLRFAGGNRAFNLEHRTAFVRRTIGAAKQIWRQPATDAFPKNSNDDVVCRHLSDRFLKPFDRLVVRLFPALDA
jgi:hypothetical protein